jgi:hypothetical protein
MALVCSEAGLAHKKHYLRMWELAPLSPSIEISGVCNLRCIACPRGERGGGGGTDATCDFMDFADYQNVPQKLLREIPWLFSVDLYVWSGPLPRPDIAEIIRHNNRGGISINLNHGKYRVSTSGFGPKNYEITRAGGSWDALYKNLLDAKSYIKTHDSKIIITILYHTNKNNLSEFAAMRNFRTTIDEIIDRRDNADFRKKCIEYSLRRFWDHPNYAKNLRSMLAELSKGSVVI